MNRDGLYEADDDDGDEEEDDIGEDLEELRRACMVSNANSDEVIAKTGSAGPDGGGGGGGMMSDSENEDDLEMLRSIKSQLASSGGGPPMGLSMPSDSEGEDDLEMLQSIKSQLALSMDAYAPPLSLSEEDDDDAFETLRAIRRRFSAYENSDPEGNFMSESTGKKKQITGYQLTPYTKTLPLTSWRHANYLFCQLRVQVSLNLHRPLLMQSVGTGHTRNFFGEN